MQPSFALSVKKSNEIISNSLNGEEVDWVYFHDLDRSMHSALAPGPDLDDMNHVMTQEIANLVNKLRLHGNQLLNISLAERSRHGISLATTNSVYGICNPFKDPNVENAF